MRTRSWKEYEEADHLCSWEAQDYSEKPWDIEQRLRRMQVILRSLVAAISRRMLAEQSGSTKEPPPCPNKVKERQRGWEMSRYGIPAVREMVDSLAELRQ
jgi:hypothetical protein